MIEIIKHGTKQVTKCKKCGCEFSYEEEDVRVTPLNKSVECPQCKLEIVIESIRNGIGGVR